MDDCKHALVGTADGVHCELCGLRMTAAQYREYSARKQATARPARKRKAVKTNE